MGKRLEDFTDEELASMSPEDFAAAAGDTQPVEANDEETKEPATQELTDKEAEEYGGEGTTTQASASAAKDEDDDEEPAPAAKVEPAEGAETGKGGKGKDGEANPAETKEPKAGKSAEVVDGEAKKDEPAAVNYEEEYKKLLAPLRANGKDLQIQSVDEMRTLAQQGANYSKKMHAMKPHLATLRMLDNAKIDQSTLSFLIDVHNRVPEAINKLVKDSGIDPMDLSTEKADAYVPRNHAPSEAEVNLESVLNELEGSEAYPKTLQVANAYDAKSKQILAENPEVLKAINQHIEIGAYDLTMNEVERQRMLGKLNGLSDLEAYRQVGNKMAASGKFAHLGAGQPNQSQQTAPAPAAAPNPRKAEDESKRNAARRAVAPVKAAPASSKAVDPDFNPLSMSDEEFAKLGGKF